MPENNMTDNITDVEIWAMRYEDISNKEARKSISSAVIRDVLSGETYRTGKDGYARLKAQVGQKLTLMFNKAGFPTVQTATVTVPEGGLKGFENEITFQAPGMIVYKILKKLLGNPKHGRSHIVTTIQPTGHNMHNDKGMPGVRVFLQSKSGEERREADMYLGQAFNFISDWSRPLIAHHFSRVAADMHKKAQTNSFLKKLTERAEYLGKRMRLHGTSRDGAAMFLDIPDGEYVLVAEKDGYEFSKTKVDVIPQSPILINVSPPQSPRVLAEPIKKAPKI